MTHSLDFSIQPQPTDSTCGPTCLHAVYQYWEDPISLDQTIQEIGQLSGGGTLAVQLACHALRRGYEAVIHVYNLQMFDPSWFGDGPVDLADKLRQQRERKQSLADRTPADTERFRVATDHYLQFLSLGGKVRMPILDEELIVRTLVRGLPMLCGLSATYLYQERRERWRLREAHGQTTVPDDIGGDPVGHFVVLYGYDPATAQVLIADPLLPNPFAPTHKYTASWSRVVAAILLGIVTYDANLLTITPRQVR